MQSIGLERFCRHGINSLIISKSFREKFDQEWTEIGDDLQLPGGNYSSGYLTKIIFFYYYCQRFSVKSSAFLLYNLNKWKPQLLITHLLKTIRRAFPSLLQSNNLLIGASIR